VHSFLHVVAQEVLGAVVDDNPVLGETIDRSFATTDEIAEI
jgi:hypothetical protein